MGSGLAVSSTPVAGIPELIDFGRNGILVDQRSPEMLADAIDKLLLDSDLSYRLARAARGTIETRFTIDRTATELFSVFQKLDCRRELDANETMQRTQ